MNESIKGLKRSHLCNDVTEKLVGETVTVMGWIYKRRKMANHTFLIIKDKTGLVQTVIDSDKADKDIVSKGEIIRSDFVVACVGTVIARTPENINAEMNTGKIEIEITELRILSQSEVPPFSSLDTGVKEDMRLKYRYLDLRRTELQENLRIRHQINMAIREFLNNEGFTDIETPVLTKSSPEGARDYLVPSRVHSGEFYALPQSPQLFKQMLMVSGFDRYFQIVKCFRDEDLRADRQPEFTQVDMELSFVDMDDVMELNERLMSYVWKKVLNIDVPTPFLRLTYDEAMERFGSDKPDVRFDIELNNITDTIKELNVDFVVFNEVIENGGRIGAINAKGCGNFPRKQIDSLVELAKTYKAKGLVYIIVQENNTYKSTVGKFFNDEQLKVIVDKLDGKVGDLILIASDKDQVVFDALGALRNEIAKRKELVKSNEYKFLWVTDFPLLEFDEEENRFIAKHHPFTSPMDEDMELFDSEPEKMRAKAYDMVLNGYELGGGSIRIYQSDIQEKMFNALGFSRAEAYEKFGYLLDAFKYGAPPHGGLAFGLDRIAMLATGSTAIRDVIAFPKVKDASCPLTDAPNSVDSSQLQELSLRIAEDDDDETGESLKLRRERERRAAERRRANDRRMISVPAKNLPFEDRRAGDRRARD